MLKYSTYFLSAVCCQWSVCIWLLIIESVIRTFELFATNVFLKFLILFFFYKNTQLKVKVIFTYYCIFWHLQKTDPVCSHFDWIFIVAKMSPCWKKLVESINAEMWAFNRFFCCNYILNDLPIYSTVCYEHSSSATLNLGYFV